MPSDASDIETHSLHILHTQSVAQYNTWLI